MSSQQALVRFFIWMWTVVEIFSQNIMFIFVFSLALILIIWRFKDFLFFHDRYQNFSQNAVPLLKTSFDLALASSGWFCCHKVWTLNQCFFAFSDELFMFPRLGAQKFQKSFRNHFFWTKSFEINRAREAEKILGSSKHMDKSKIYNLLHPFLQTGLLTSSGDKWHQRRRMLTPAFHFDILKEFFEVFKEESDKLVEILKEKVNEELNVIPISSKFTLNTICGNQSWKFET